MVGLGIGVLGGVSGPVAVGWDAFVFHRGSGGGPALPTKAVGGCGEQEKAGEGTGVRGG